MNILNLRRHRRKDLSKLLWDPAPATFVAQRPPTGQLRGTAMSTPCLQALDTSSGNTGQRNTTNDLFDIGIDEQNRVYVSSKNHSKRSRGDQVQLPQDTCKTSKKRRLSYAHGARENALRESQISVSTEETTGNEETIHQAQRRLARNDSGNHKPRSISITSRQDFMTSTSDCVGHQPNDLFKPPTPPSSKLLGRLTTLKDSFASVSFGLCDRMTSWGRARYCTESYSDKDDTRIPKLAMMLVFWGPGLERFEKDGGVWTSWPGVFTTISTMATSSIYINDIELRDVSKDHQAKLWGKLYSGDIITIYGKDKPPSLKFLVEIFFGDSARPRPKSENEFQVQREVYHHQRSQRNATKLEDNRLGTASS